jgi:2-hydroxychromene-2-carboxylate isomerase
MCEKVPENFPINTMNTQRALTVVHMEQPDKVADVLAAFYKAFWEDRKPINKPEVVAPILAKALGISEDEAKAIWAKGSKPEAKSLLAKNTDRAFDEGAFGLPWFIGMFQTCPLSSRTCIY